MQLTTKITRLFVCLLLAGCVFSLYCCSNKNTPGKSQAKLKFAPPSTNHLRENIFIDEMEVSNMSWGEYMYWIKNEYSAESPQFKATLPDTLVWKNCYNNFSIHTNQDHTDIESLVYLYLRHPQYNHFPVVGISFEQATNFCEWRTNRVNEVLYVNKHKEVTFPIDSSIVIPKQVKFRLPTEEEWEYAAREGFDSLKYINNTDKFYFYTLETSSARTIKQTYDKFIPMVESSLQPDRYNRYHLVGNVAEMINVKGIAKGGSYVHPINDSYYTKRILYRHPDYWLGFRCVCEILPEKK